MLLQRGIDLGNPVSDHPLNRGLERWYLGIQTRTGYSFPELTRGRFAAVTGTKTTPWQPGSTSVSRGGYFNNDRYYRTDTTCNSSNWTVAIRYMLTSTTSYRVLYDGQSSGARIGFYSATENVAYVRLGAGGNNLTPTLSGTRGLYKWQTAIITRRTGGACYWYANGVRNQLVASEAEASAAFDSIGAYLYSTQGWGMRGLIESIATFNYFMSDSQALALTDQYDRGYPDLLRRSSRLMSRAATFGSGGTPASVTASPGMWWAYSPAPSATGAAATSAALASVWESAPAPTASGAAAVTGEPATTYLAAVSPSSTGAAAVTGEPATIYHAATTPPGTGEATISSEPATAYFAPQSPSGSGAATVTSASATWWVMPALPSATGAAAVGAEPATAWFTGSTVDVGGAATVEAVPSSLWWLATAPSVFASTPATVAAAPGIVLWMASSGIVLQSTLSLERAEIVFDVGDVVPYDYDPSAGDEALAKTPLTASSAYCSVAEMLKRIDKRTVADLVSDTGEAVESNTLSTNAELLAAMLDASGEVESAAMKGSRYTPADLQALTGAAKARLCRMLVRLTICFLYERRPDKGPIPEVYKAALDQLEQLRSGEMIFGTVETHDAQTQDHRVETARDVENRDGTSFISRRFFGRRTNRADGSE